MILGTKVPKTVRILYQDGRVEIIPCVFDVKTEIDPHFTEPTGDIFFGTGVETGHWRTVASINRIIVGRSI